MMKQALFPALAALSLSACGAAASKEEAQVKSPYLATAVGRIDSAGDRTVIDAADELLTLERP